jgi:hypothetical protein
MWTGTEKQKSSSGYQVNQCASPLSSEACKEWDTRRNWRNAPLGTDVRYWNAKLLEKYFGIIRTVELQADIHVWRKEQSQFLVVADVVVALSSMYTGEAVTPESKYLISYVSNRSAVEVI